MRLGEHTIGVRTRTPRVDGAGNPVRDDHGEPVLDVIDRVIDWCLVGPTRRDSDNREPEDRSAPTLSGMTLLAPPGTALGADALIVWPITSATVNGAAVSPATAETTAGGVVALTGPVWQVDGEPQRWDESLEARLRKAT